MAKERATKKVTVEVPLEDIEKAQCGSDESIEQTVRWGLRLLAERRTVNKQRALQTGGARVPTTTDNYDPKDVAEACAELLKLKGTMDIELDIEDIRRNRERGTDWVLRDMERNKE